MFLDDFFRVNKEIDLPARKGKKPEKVIVRTLSDSEIQERSEYALSEQARMSNVLRDPESDVYRAKIGPLDSATDEALIDTMAEIRRVDAAREAQETLRLDFFPFPEDANDQEKLETLKRQREHEEAVYASRVKYITEDEKANRKRWAELPREVLLSNAKHAAIKLYMLKASIEAEVYYTVASATETLSGDKKWDIPKAKKLSGKMVDYLMEQYREVDSIDPWELTKSESSGDVSGMGDGDQNGERHDAGTAA